MQEVSPYDVPVFRIGKRMPLKRLMVKYAENYGFRLSKLEFYNSKGMKLETYDTANLLGPQNLKLIFVKINVRDAEG